ncbi:MAG TPA: tRNA uridine-5-carboxymethylaminomethyl(34) synthesis GTPase MnmE, partial [Candidatus Eisenbacteria bacterium]|nr:tRNA uridine-5-carboxymethylaminomethyl(34) synthesis GTPase MnmE [Candidatus Eisenbacteria bacterium]
MIRFALDDTIASLATPAGTGALAVIRLSGREALSIGDRVFRGERVLSELAGFQGAHGWIHDASGPIDEIVIWVYRGPRSYTGEDMLEISCHGGSLSAARVLEALWAAGARPASPGEFTRRAFSNGRIDLTQAEAVADVIAARGRRAHEQALLQLQGGLSERVRSVAKGIREVMVEVEAHLDFGEDVPEIPESAGLAARLRVAEVALARLAGSHLPSRRVREGCVVALIGKPNVGKSSLLNALAGRDRALVHDVPGTTRDVLDVMVEWSGVPVRLVDTAGLRSNVMDAVEQAGIERTHREVRGADVALWVVDGSKEPGAEDLSVGAGLDPECSVLVLNKSDLGRDARWSNVHSPRVEVSALTGAGVNELQQSLEVLVGNGLAKGEESIWVANERHARELVAAGEGLARGREVLESGGNLELCAADLHRSLSALGAI